MVTYFQHRRTTRRRCGNCRRGWSAENQSQESENHMTDPDGQTRIDEKINNWSELAELAQTYSVGAGEWIFRGVRKKSYELIPKIGRPENWPAHQGFDAEQELRLLDEF